MTEHRIVRVAETFFTELDEKLGADRGPNGEPSATDFLVVDLPPIVERFASSFDAMPEVVPGYSSARVLISRGLLIRAVAVFGILNNDNSIDLVGVEFDL